MPKRGERDGMPSKDTVTVAAVQRSPVYMDKEATTDRAVDAIEEAGANGADLVAFAENYLAGYPAYYTPGFENDAGERARFTRAFQESAIRIPGEATDHIGRAAAVADAYVLMGCNELDDRRGRGTIYNAQFLMNPDGNVEYSRRKLVPTHTERTYHGRGDGSDVRVASTPFGNVGSLVCWEHHMALLRAALIRRGEHVHVAAWPGSWSPGSERSMEADRGSGDCDLFPAAREHAFEAGAFTVSVSGVLSASSVPDDLAHLLDGDHMNIDWACGGSCIIDPFGRIVEGPVFDEETILYHECDLAARRLAKAVFDHEGHYGRPDVFDLRVRDGRRPARRGSIGDGVDLAELAGRFDVAVEKLQRIVEHLDHQDAGDGGGT